MRIVIDSFGEKAVARDLLGLAGRALDVEPAMVEILGQLRDATEQQFNSQGAYGSGGWAPNAESTLEQKRRDHLDMRVLHARLRMRGSLTNKADAEAVSVARHDGLDYGTSVPYARYHQTGTKRMPRRRPVQYPDRVRRGIAPTIQRHVHAETTTAGRGML